VDWGFAEPEASSENAVRIISVHKSKGLEFPVVFLAELNSSFSKKDFQSDCLADIHETLGLQIIDRQANAKLSSLGHQVIAEKKLSVGLAEEMRILYVATTRARERLILTACEKRQNCRSVISNGFFFGDQTIPDWQLRSCQNHLEWVLYGLCDQRKLHKGFETGLEEKNLDDGLFSFRLYGQDEHKQLSEYIDGLKKSKLSDRRPRTKSSKKKQEQSKSLLSQVKKTLAWQYRFGDVPLLPAKQSVTQLTHPGDEYLRSDYSKVLQLKPRAILAAEPDMAGAIDPRMIGSATHLVISRLDLSRPVTQQAVKETKEKLIADNALSRAAAERVETEPIVAFFQSELGREATGADSIIWCEWPFTFALAAGEFIDSGGEQRATSNELIVVQGIIDMLVQTAEGLLVIDFKTDHISAEQAAERAGEYRRQLELYGKAVQAVFKVGAIDKWLYFLSPGCAIQI
jgi:ATP-dependent helicase/nuclease subunit A